MLWSVICQIVNGVNMFTSVLLSNSTCKSILILCPLLHLFLWPCHYFLNYDKINQMPTNASSFPLPSTCFPVRFESNLAATLMCPRLPRDSHSRPGHSVIDIRVTQRTLRGMSPRHPSPSCIFPPRPDRRPVRPFAASQASRAPSRMWGGRQLAALIRFLVAPPGGWSAKQGAESALAATPATHLRVSRRAHQPAAP